MSKSLRLAVCLFPGVTSLDFQGPLELFSFISSKKLSGSGSRYSTPPAYSIDATYLSHSLDPVVPDAGPRMKPDATYIDKINEKYDMLLVPGGPGARPNVVPDALIEFLKQQAPNLQYLLSVCTGSWILAKAGLLEGKKATSNKATMKDILEWTSKQDEPNITWVRKARWVVDDNEKLWTSSGVTAGQDMAYAFLVRLIGKESTEVIRNVVELSVKGDDDDEFADYYGLLD